jgi:hypothetical protein
MNIAILAHQFQNEIKAGVENASLKSHLFHYPEFGFRFWFPEIIIIARFFIVTLLLFLY